MTSNKSWRHQVPDPSDMLQHYLPAMRALQNGQNPWADNPKLLEETPDLKHTVWPPRHLGRLQPLAPMAQR